MFDAFKKVNYVKEIAKRFEKSSSKSRDLLEAKRASRMELFVNIVNGLLLSQ